MGIARDDRQARGFWASPRPRVGGGNRDMTVVGLLEDTWQRAAYFVSAPDAAGAIAMARAEAGDGDLAVAAVFEGHIAHADRGQYAHSDD